MKSFLEFKLYEVAPSGSIEEKVNRETGIEFLLILKKILNEEYFTSNIEDFLEVIEEIIKNKDFSINSFDGNGEYLTHAEIIGEAIHKIRGNTALKKFGV